MNISELNVITIDIETYKALFLVCCKEYTTGAKISFELSYRKNEIDYLVRYLQDNNKQKDFFVTYNGIAFDSQVLQFIINKNESWYNSTYTEVLNEIYEFAQKTIDDRNYNIPIKYKEDYLDFKQIDLMAMLHFNGDAKRTSLKFAEFSMDLDIEELPIDFRKEHLTEDEVEQIISYCWNDIHATETLYNFCIGKTEHPDYKGKDKIQLRLDLIDEYKLPYSAVNWNDVKIGTELNKKAYLEIRKIDESKLNELVRNRSCKHGFKFEDCYPSYIKFETKMFQEFFSTAGKERVIMTEKQEFPFNFKGVNYMFAKGGAHSKDTPRVVTPPNKYKYLSCDVGSMYPNGIRKNNIYPNHLGPKWNEVYVLNIAKRLEAKKLYKQTGEKKYDNFQETYKLILNGNFG